jgi:hypothetical protein
VCLAALGLGAVDLASRDARLFEITSVGAAVQDFEFLVSSKILIGLVCGNRRRLRDNCGER